MGLKKVKEVPGYKPGLSFAVLGAGMMGKIGPGALAGAGNQVTHFLGKDEAEVEQYLLKSGMVFPNLQYVGTLDDYPDALKQVDAVYIATIPIDHIPKATAAVKAGKHVYLEKPISVDSGELKDFIGLVQHSSTPAVAVQVNSQYRFHSAFNEMKLRVNKDGDEIEKISEGYIQDWQKDPLTDIGWRPELLFAGRGKLVPDLGTHKLITLLDFVGSQARIVDFEGSLYNVHPVRKRLKPEVKAKIGAGGTWADADKVPKPSENPELWEDMDMLDRDKYSGDDISFARFNLDLGGGKRVPVELIGSQVTPGSNNNFYIHVKTKRGHEYVLWQEEPNHIDHFSPDGKYERIERKGSPGLIDTPIGHPHGYEKAVKRGVYNLTTTVLSGDEGAIRMYTGRNLLIAKKAMAAQELWTGADLVPYTGQVDTQLNEWKHLKLRALKGEMGNLEASLTKAQ